ncbi:hypothetical protein CC80DRAFT_546011 [Byssothecium circinans]|uniref:Uncharacterized protein n=1 Tax=Byssothecium circinans TaxID=147558 RepID=A0A6A5UC64_9PLEO|nr:hypothetical protein CC80DRAFT_546011 [Byssothecium circinans]
MIPFRLRQLQRYFTSTAQTIKVNGELDMEHQQERPEKSPPNSAKRSPSSSSTLEPTDLEQCFDKCMWVEIITLPILTTRTLHEATPATPEINVTVYKVRVNSPTSTSDIAFLPQETDGLDVSAAEKIGIEHTTSPSSSIQSQMKPTKPKKTTNTSMASGTEKAEPKPLGKTSSSTYFDNLLGQGTADAFVARQNLESYFEGLRKEFEDKTGKSWTPLRKVEDEVWSLDDEDVDVDVELWGSGDMEQMDAEGVPVRMLAGGGVLV